ncbi:MAG: glutathione peroxidase [Gemmataceae bacterium]
MTTTAIATTLYDIPVTTIDGESTTLDRYRGRVLLVVNVASRCGFTPQYAGLESLYRSHKDRGFVVLGFPCDQFAHQEPGDEAEIKKYCSTRFGVTFPMFAKVRVNGPETHPLYCWLKSQKRGLFGTRSIKWNFTKFLVDRNGTVVQRYGPFRTPERIDRDVVPLLQSR